MLGKVCTDCNFNKNAALPQVFSSHFLRPRMSGEFDSRKDYQSTKFKRRPRIFVKLSFRELCDSKYAFDNMAIIHKVQIG